MPMGPMEVRGGAEIHLQSMGPYTGAREAVTTGKGHAGADSWQNLWTMEKQDPTLEGVCWQDFFGGLSPVGVTPHENRRL